MDWQFDENAMSCKSVKVPNNDYFVWRITKEFWSASEKSRVDQTGTYLGSFENLSDAIKICEQTEMTRNTVL